MKAQAPSRLALPLLLLLLLLPFCRAQCTLDVPDSQLLTALNQAGIIPETDPSKFSLQDLTYLCFVRSTTDNTRFDQVRVSMLYTYDTATSQSAQATFSVCVVTFRFSGANINSVKEETHFTANLTREGCRDCLDSSSFASPTFCRLDNPCTATSCANGGTCNRTGLTTFSCACNGNWAGATCNACSLSCHNGGTLNTSSCTCNCADGFSGANCGTCSRVCQNGGTLNSESCMCACAGGFSGSNCNTCPLSCQNGGTLNTSSCACNCADGYSGASCGTCSRVCQNGGTLNSESCMCTCAGGFSGSNCNTCPLSCQNGGTLNTSSCTCNCVDGFSGASCGTCSRVCQNGGTLNSESCSCSCAGGFTGSNCDTCPLSCQNGGTLSTRSCTCNCVDGFSGATCGNQTCVRTCQNRGTLNAGTCTCACANGFSGTNCETCSRSCQNGGTLNTRSCACQCAGGFSGSNCETCSLSCQNGGTLTRSSCTCNCADGFSGASCGTCNRMCQNGGTLTLSSCMCTCAAGFSGPSCERRNDVCSVQPEGGHCKPYRIRYCFNLKTTRCEKFLWGGCGSNGNNFRSLSQCQQKCMHKIQRCPVKGQRFSSCAKPCKDTCDYRRPKCAARCRPGCTCPKGQVIDTRRKRCVPIKWCPPKPGSCPAIRRPIWSRRSRRRRPRMAKQWSYGLRKRQCYKDAHCIGRKKCCCISRARSLYVCLNPV